ncbi:hypothetical protein AB0O75_36805 [Streptomyces sp. NPDC088921]|uniref:hypothetical protein n=1 Tax=unclassified Streptomyces TaxID=2593676 RepID=UPI00344493FA
MNLILVVDASPETIAPAPWGGTGAIGHSPGVLLQLGHVRHLPLIRESSPQELEWLRPVDANADSGVRDVSFGITAARCRSGMPITRIGIGGT